MTVSSNTSSTEAQNDKRSGFVENWPGYVLGISVAIWFLVPMFSRSLLYDAATGEFDRQLLTNIRAIATIPLTVVLLFYAVISRTRADFGFWLFWTLFFAVPTADPRMPPPYVPHDLLLAFYQVIVALALIDVVRRIVARFRRSKGRLAATPNN